MPLGKPRPPSQRPAGKLIDIELPLESTGTKININATTTAQQVLDIVTKRDAYQGTVYAFAIAPVSRRKEFFDPSTPLASHKEGNFTIVISGIGVDVLIEQRGTVEKFLFGSDFTVRECVHFIEQCNCKGSRVSSSGFTDQLYALTHDLYLATSEGAKENLSLSPDDGTRMEPDRLLSSYRLKLGDTLIFSRSRACKNFWEPVDTTGKIPLSISISGKDNDGSAVTKTLEFETDTTYADVLRKFFREINAPYCSMFFSLFLEMDDGSGKQLYYMHSDWNLKTFVLPKPAVFYCRGRTIPPRQWFGVEPTSLPMAKDADNGLIVPEILLILKEILINLGGYTVEGIFRKAGLESEMENIRAQLRDGKTFVSYNEHTIATMLKRWFKALPCRLLSKVSQGDQSEEFILNYQKYLDRTSANLISWILDLLLNVVHHGSENFMDPKNCSIVWGPCLVGSNEEENIADETDMFASMQNTGFASRFITTNLSVLSSKSEKPYGVADSTLMGQTAQCIANHPRSVRGELDVLKGDFVTIIEDAGGEWLFVQQNVRYGFVAKNFFQITERASGRLSARPIPPTFAK